MVALVAPSRRPRSWKTALAIGIAAAVFFVLVGEPARFPWLVVVLSLVYVAFLLRYEPINQRHLRSTNEAFREGLFAFGFTSLVMFSIGNFATPEIPDEPFRMSITIGLAWGVVAYRLARGYPQTGWRLLATLLAVMVPITVLWLVVARLIAG